MGHSLRVGGTWFRARVGARVGLAARVWRRIGFRIETNVRVQVRDRAKAIRT